MLRHQHRHGYGLPPSRSLGSAPKRTRACIVANAPADHAPLTPQACTAHTQQSSVAAGTHPSSHVMQQIQTNVSLRKRETGSERACRRGTGSIVQRRETVHVPARVQETDLNSTPAWPTCGSVWGVKLLIFPCRYTECSHACPLAHTHMRGTSVL